MKVRPVAKVQHIRCLLSLLITCKISIWSRDSPDHKQNRLLWIIDRVVSIVIVDLVLNVREERAATLSKTNEYPESNAVMRLFW